MAVSAIKRKPATDIEEEIPQTPVLKKQKKLLFSSSYTANTGVKRTSPHPRTTVINNNNRHHTNSTTTTTTTDITRIPIPTDMTAQLHRIAHSTNTTPYQKRVLSLLCQVPRGHVTTYGLLAKHLGSSARAVGNAMRRNPFAPAVPCHRVVATGGGLGGFKGAWPRGSGDREGGITLEEKKVLLRAEGVRFDGGGRVMGTPFCGFV